MVSMPESRMCVLMIPPCVCTCHMQMHSTGKMRKHCDVKLVYIDVLLTL